MGLPISQVAFQISPDSSLVPLFLDPLVAYQVVTKIKINAINHHKDYDLDLEEILVVI